MDPRTVSERLHEVQLVDVRLDNEWEAGHIEGAVHIPDEDLPDHLDELDRTRPIVTVCRAGTRSEEAAEWLRGEGFDAQNLDGGLLAWKWAGLPLTGPIVEPQASESDISPEHQALMAEFMEVAFAAQKRFGDREPSHEEMREFLRERLVNEGRTPEEAEEFLTNMGED